MSILAAKLGRLRAGLGLVDIAVSMYDRAGILIRGSQIAVSIGVRVD